MISVDTMMQLPGYVRSGAQWLGAMLVASAATVLMVWLGANSTTAGMVFLALVVWFASQAGILLAVFVTLLCAVAFDYYFLPPIRTMQIVGVQQWVAMICFLVCCAVVARVAELARRRARQATERREDLERLYTLSQEMMLQGDAAVLVRDLPRIIARVFALDAVALYVCDQGQFYASTAELPMGIQASLREVAEGAEAAAIIPGEIAAVRMMLGLRPVGALGVRPPRLSQEVATAMSAQVAIALTRATAIEASTRLEAARAGERLRAALIDSLTHELRTPLTSIRAAATTLLDTTGLDEAGRLDLASIVVEESARLDTLIGEAVEMAEIDANVVEVRPAPHQVRELLEQAVEESRKVLAGRRVVLDVDTPDEPAWFDPHLLGRVLRHLLENAARYTAPGGRITLRGYRRENRLEFQVEDDGPGIDAADLPFIFDKFYRGKKGISKGKGSGMGLAITRAILAAHGGKIEVDIAHRPGAGFRFWVPLVERELGGKVEDASSRK